MKKIRSRKVMSIIGASWNPISSSCFLASFKGVVGAELLVGGKWRIGHFFVGLLGIVLLVFGGGTLEFDFAR